MTEQQTAAWVPPYVEKREREIDGYLRQAQQHDAMAAEYRQKIVEIRGEIEQYQKDKGL